MVLFHADVPWVSGGFVGVDIFFVISGFLITRILYDQARTSGVSIIGFYERRIRRIFPALFAMLVASSIAACIWLLPPDLVKFGHTLAGAALSVSNVVLWREAGYFDVSSELNPLLHTWSLGVEEQFYVIFPIALALVYKYARNRLALVLALAALASCALCIWITVLRPTAAFFLLPFRAWELLLGSLLAIGAVPALHRQSSRNIVAGLAMLAILIPLFTYSRTTAFPGWAAFAPTLGAAALIHVGAQGSFVTAMLACRPLVYIGLLSYSLYLWHWPILAFFKYRIGNELPFALTVALIVLSGIAGWVSWRWIEQPFRSAALLRSLHAVARAGIAAMAAALGIASVLAYAKGFPGRLSEEAQRFTEIAASPEHTRIYDYGRCFLNYKQGSADYSEKNCARFTGNAKTKVLIYGDSYAAHLFAGLTAASPDTVEIRQYTATACRPLKSGFHRCDDVHDGFFEKILPATDADLVVVSAYWGNYYKRVGGETLAQQLSDTLARIKQRGKKTVLVGQSPTYPRPVPYAMAMMPSQASAGDFDIPAEDWSKLNRLLKSVADAQAVPFVDLYGYACSGHICHAARDGQPFHWDLGHMTATGSKYFAAAIVPYFEQARQAESR
ncbi:O-acetyltransferase OatA [Pigmentiphaga humi]|uniref:O-acetyltransferase OatA n=2 Tax=Pigmentiphaga humi TaxID=2478468 RepID=A0A3P4B7W0_9BURK|nr:O-acetyltransferase OatA [Pigmentiphaga humi]